MVFSLSRGEVSIGRDLSNQILIDDFSVSRHHCLIKSETEGYKILDLESHNRTFVNNLPITERVLEHGDRIKVGHTLFIFKLRDDEASPVSNEVQFEDGPLITETVVSLGTDEALHTMARELSVLIRISSTINSIVDFNNLQKRLIEMIFEIVPAQRAAILLAAKEAGQFSSVFGLIRHKDEKTSIQVSHTVTQQVLKEGVGILCRDVHEKFKLTESLATSNVQSLLCVPLKLVEKVLGVIYLDTSDSTAHLDQGHLQLVTGIANIAAGALENAQQIQRLKNENRRLRADIEFEHNILGQSPLMLEVYQYIAKVAPTNSTVLIYGESGTGKELAARAVHQNSPRAANTFVAVNCAVLSENLLESELFGHEKGAFTGALAQKKGRFELADEGTIFLDEVGEMSPALQAKLLRVLQEREFERVGGVRTIKVDTRIVAATNKNLKEAIKQGTFRQDLYYRLNVVSLTLPPLRERSGDVLLLARHFVAKYAEKCKRQVEGISQEAQICLINYDWPGNVRELENVIERAVVLGMTTLILPEDLPESVLERGPAQMKASGLTYNELVNNAKRQIIQSALEQANWNYIEVAKQLGIHPNNLHRLIRSLKLETPAKK